jgi:hypothetical protein
MDLVAKGVDDFMHQHQAGGDRREIEGVVIPALSKVPRSGRHQFDQQVFGLQPIGPQSLHQGVTGRSITRRTCLGKRFDISDGWTHHGALRGCSAFLPRDLQQARHDLRLNDLPHGSTAYIAGVCHGRCTRPRVVSGRVAEG